MNKQEKTNEYKTDVYYRKAVQMFVQNPQMKTSELQKKLGLGYSRAGRIMDMLKEDGVFTILSSTLQQIEEEVRESKTHDLNEFDGYNQAKDDFLSIIKKHYPSK